MSTGPMQFPRPGRLLLWIVVFFFGLPAVLTAFVLLAYAQLDPVQSFYFVAYVESAIEGDTKGGSVTVQYASKTAPGRQPAPLLPGDAVRNMTTKQRLSLSPKAISEGWQASRSLHRGRRTRRRSNRSCRRLCMAGRVPGGWSASRC